MTRKIASKERFFYFYLHICKLFCTFAPDLENEYYEKTINTLFFVVFGHDM